MNKKLKHENIVFKTLREADVWADSILNEIHGATINGYVTPDPKIAYALAFMLCRNPSYLVRTDEEIKPDVILYKVWVEERSDI